jgi:hypothetical protein
VKSSYVFAHRFLSVNNYLGANLKKCMMIINCVVNKKPYYKSPDYFKYS